MKFLLNEFNSSGREFDNIQKFLDAISELAETYEENGEEVFEVEIIAD